MKPIRVNIDYEEVLRGGAPRPLMNAAIEFLAFWVQDAPVLVHRDYPAEYLSHVELSCGRRPVLIRQGDAVNWWGSLDDVALEKKLNSKIWARQWWQGHWPMEGSVAYSEAEAREALGAEGTWLIKRDHGMSGKGHWKTTLNQWDATRERLKNWFAEGVLIEPLYERVSDLSALWLPEEKRFIYYRNHIDPRFQWKGARIENGGAPAFSQEEERWLVPWREQLARLASQVQELGYGGVFSVDAFFHRRDGQLAFQPCSEVNARRTMGWIVYQLWQRQRPAWGELALAGDGLQLAPPGAPLPWVWREP